MSVPMIPFRIAIDRFPYDDGRCRQGHERPDLRFARERREYHRAVRRMRHTHFPLGQAVPGPHLRVSIVQGQYAEKAETPPRKGSVLRVLRSNLETVPNVGPSIEGMEGISVRKRIPALPASSST